MHVIKPLFVLILVAVICGGVCAPPALAEDKAPDSIKAALDRAKAAHAEAAANAGKDLLIVLDDKIKSVAKTGDLNGLKQLIAEREAFVADGKLPSSKLIRPAVAKYSLAVKHAEDALIGAYQKAIKDYTRKMQIEQAEAVQKKMKAFLAKRKAGSAFDPILTRLNNAKKLHRTKLADAKGDLLAQLDHVIRAVADRGDLDGVKALHAAKKQFQTDSTLPELKEAAAKGAKARYERAVTVAGGILKAAYEKAIRDYKRKKQFDRAEEIAADMIKTLGSGPSAQWTDLLKPIDPKKHTVAGKWERVRTGLLGHQQKTHCRIAVPLAPQGNYELQASFTRRKGQGGIVFILPVAAKQAMFSCGGLTPGLKLSPAGKAPSDAQASAAGDKLANGKAHSIQINVTASGKTAKIHVDLNGKSFLRWSGPQARLYVPAIWRLRQGSSLGMGMHDSEVEFHQVKLRKLPSKATPRDKPAKTADSLRRISLDGTLRMLDAACVCSMTRR